MCLSVPDGLIDMTTLCKTCAESPNTLNEKENKAAEYAQSCPRIFHYNTWHKGTKHTVFCSQLTLAQDSIHSQYKSTFQDGEDD
jgi:hypothetical protein